MIASILMLGAPERKQPAAERQTTPASECFPALNGITPFAPNARSSSTALLVWSNVYIGSKPMLVLEQVPLAPLTTLGVGGPARYFVEAHSDAEVREAVHYAQARDLPLFALGGGSNLLVSDRGFDGLVLKVALRGIDRTAADNDVAFSVAAGEPWDDFVARVVDENCAGIECLSGIPGSVGGTPVQNVGAYGQDVSETITEVEALDRQSLQLRTFTNAECGFGYRTSLFNTSERDRYIILNVSFSLRRNGKAALRYADLQKAFADVIGEPTLLAIRKAVREIRRSKAMLIVPGDDDARSAGSFFKNPVVPQRQFEALAAKLLASGLVVPNYPVAEGFRKIPAAWLVERAGFAKSYGRGAAGISRRHTLAIVNRGGATAADIVALKDDIQSRVLAEFGIHLQPEPVFLGFS
jgi:UDP-N-acetylmuramate dehydrogenase